MFLTAAAGHAIAFEVPPTALIQGVPGIGGAALALGSLALASRQVGLAERDSRLRLGMLGLLLVTVVKVFLFDLSVLNSIYRVTSLFVLGGLLLLGAFAYQRLRPPPVPDLRTVHPSRR